MFEDMFVFQFVCIHSKTKIVISIVLLSFAAICSVYHSRNGDHKLVLVWNVALHLLSAIRTVNSTGVT